MLLEKDPPAWTRTSRIVLHETVVQREEGRRPLLGCLRSRRFLEVDEATLAAVEALRSEPSIEAAEKRVEEETGEEYDLEAFVRILADRGFVASVDGLPYGGDPPGVGAPDVLARVPPASVRWIRHPATLATVTALVAGWIGVTVYEPASFPRFDDLVISRYPSVVLLASLAGTLAFAYAHELAHYFTALSYGIRSRIKVSHRFLLLTLETDVTNAWTLKPRERLPIFAAGMLLNLALAALFVLLDFAAAAGILPLSHAWRAAFRFLAFLNLFPVLYQLMIFARTDLYYVLLTALGERNLYAHARGYLQLRIRRVLRRLARIPPRPCPECGGRTYHEEPFCLRCGATLPVRDPNLYPFTHASRRRLLTFGIVVLLGQVLGLAYMAFILVGFHGRYIEFGLDALRAALSGSGGPGFWIRLLDSVAVLALASLQVALMGYFVLRDLARPVVNVVRRRLRRTPGADAPGTVPPTIPARPSPSPRPTDDARTPSASGAGRADADAPRLRKRRKNKGKRRSRRVRRGVTA